MVELVYIGQMLRLSGEEESADQAALDIAQRKSGPSDARLLTYIKSHRQAAPYKRALKRVLAGMGKVFVAALIIAALTGFFAGFSAFGETSDGGRVNVFWLLASLLGVHLLTLAFWLVFIWRKPGGSVSLSRFLNQALVWLTRRTPADALAAQAVGQVQLKASLGRASVSVFSHGFWCIYLVAGVMAAVLLLSIQSYEFMWETTLLGTDTVVSIFSTIGKPLAAIGLAVPGETAILAAESATSTALTKQDASMWARFCLASLVLYGVGPRAVLWALCWLWRSKALTKVRLDPSEPFFASLLAQIYQPAPDVEVVDPDTSRTVASSMPEVSAASDNAQLPSATLIGWEIDTLSDPFGRSAKILGPFEDAASLETALADMNGAPVTLAVSLLNTPDRGVEHALQAFSVIPRDNRNVFLLDERALQERAQKEDVTRRIADWWGMLTRLGFDPSSITVYREIAHD